MTHQIMRLTQSKFNMYFRGKSVAYQALILIKYLYNVLKNALFTPCKSWHGAVASQQAFQQNSHEIREH